MINVAGLPCGHILHEYFPHCFSLDEGIQVAYRMRASEGFLITCDEKQIIIEADSTSSLLSALGAYIQGRVADAHRFENVNVITFRGLMLDASRNAVPTVEALKERFVVLALMGMNYFCLYTEDTFEVKSEPLIGYKRGRYSKDEIRELVLFADSIGITMFPCFQTLGHLEQVLRYQSYADLQDNHRVLNVTSDDVYAFIEALIDEIIEPYNTNLIHVGMDEPWGLGYGKAYSEETPVPPNELYVEHVKRVTEMCTKRGLEPIIWGDFVLGRSDNRALTREQREAVPRECSLAYWNYFDTEPQAYRDHLEILSESNYQTIIAPGFHTWNRFFPDISFARKTLTACMDAVKGQGARLLETVWGDDGHECLFDTNWSSFYSYFSLSMYGDEIDSCRHQFFESLFKTDSSLFSALSGLEENLGVFSMNPEFPASKMIFYDDPLLGVACGASDCSYILDLCNKCRAELNAVTLVSEQFADLKQLMMLYVQCVEGKVKLYMESRKAYEERDYDLLREVVKSCEQLITRYQQFAETYRNLWHVERKSFGYEVVDGRFGAMCSRLGTFVYAIERFLSGDTTVIEFFEEPDIQLQPRDLQFYSHAQTRCFSIW